VNQDSDVTGSADDDFFIEVTPKISSNASVSDVGREVDNAIEKPSGGREKTDDTKAKSTPPKVEDWQDFFSRILIKTATDYYLTRAFNGVDENLLSDREVDRIKLTENERDRIARPFAELANKLKFTRKHGRAIIASTGSFESLVTLAQWTNRVNRISRKYRQPPQNRHQPQQQQYPPRQQASQEPVQGTVIDEHPGSYTPNGNGPPPTGPAQGFSIYQPGTG
jgi:hypothetical protein